MEQADENEVGLAVLDAEEFAGERLLHKEPFADDAAVRVIGHLAQAQAENLRQGGDVVGVEVLVGLDAGPCRRSRLE